MAPTVLDEGIDVPAADMAVVAGGSKSRRQMIQRMGRVLRLKAGGGKATFIIVYARGTIEDVTVHDGSETCLDMITESADSVTLDGRPLEGMGRARFVPANREPQAAVMATAELQLPEHEPSGPSIGSSESGPGAVPHGVNGTVKSTYKAKEKEAAPVAREDAGSDVVARLYSLAELYREGLLTDDEFTTAKSRVLQNF